jgi:hypothetical protein
MVSVLSAHDFGYLTVDEVTEQTDQDDGDDRQTGAL